MKLYHVECEYDMGFNLEGRTGIYSTTQLMTKALEEADWESVEFKDWRECQKEGLLFITEIEE